MACCPPFFRIWLLAAAGETANWSGAPVGRAGERGCVATRTGAWWCARAVVAHWRLLVSRRAPEKLWAEAVRLFEAALQRFGRRGPHVENGSLAAQIWLEWGLAQMHFDRPSGVCTQVAPLLSTFDSRLISRLVSRSSLKPGPPGEHHKRTSGIRPRSESCGVSGQAHQIPNSQPPSTGRRRQARSAGAAREQQRRSNRDSSMVL